MRLEPKSGLPTYAEVARVLAYDPATGVLTWRVTNSNCAPAGSVAGSLTPKGYRLIGVFRRVFRAHRVAFLLMTGRWPDDQIDHIDGDPLNNRWSNLREATARENRQNTRRVRSDSKSGVHGVTLTPRGTWVAQIRAGGPLKYLGTYTTPEEAHAAYLKAKRELHPYNTL